MVEKINLAIDGPVGSGKTTIGRLLAQKLNYQFLDSGLLFRHFAKFCWEFESTELDKQNFNNLPKKTIIEWCEK
jgi:cytidylate kinase